MPWYTSLLKDASAAVGGKLIDKIFPQKTDYSHLQKGIQWRVSDAKKAGIHPLYALGASISSPTVTTGSAGSDMARSVIESSMRKDRGAASQAIIESKARTNSYNASAARDFALAAKAESDTARSGVDMNVNQDYGVQDSVIDPRPRAVKESRGKRVRPGRGSPAQRGEDEYGELWEVENLVRYIRDIVGPQTKQMIHDYTNPRIEVKPRKRLTRRGYRSD